MIRIVLSSTSRAILGAASLRDLNGREATLASGSSTLYHSTLKRFSTFASLNYRETNSSPYETQSPVKSGPKHNIQEFTEKKAIYIYILLLPATAKVITISHTGNTHVNNVVITVLGVIFFARMKLSPAMDIFEHFIPFKQFLNSSPQ